jgi:phytoene dehydrogenase-like protein
LIRHSDIRHSSFAMYDALIIGAGMSGLAAGVRMAQFGLRVCILERHTTIGGLNSFYRLDGHNYDVGLHAVTNFQPKGAKHGPLPRVLRQLRFSWDEFQWVPQTKSAVAFPCMRLEFSNDIELLTNEVARAFPRQIDAFRRLIAGLIAYDDLGQSGSERSARTVFNEFIADPLLVEMLLCPLLYYGGAREHDMDFAQASVMFRSIYLEGFARPAAGVRTILKLLTRRFKELGGELRLRAGVRRIVADGDEVRHLVLDDDSELSGRCILSSAGWCETMRLCDGGPPPLEQTPPGQLSFVESIALLDCPPRELDYPYSILFFNDSEHFHWEKPRDRLTDVRSGVICSPENFAYERTPERGVDIPVWQTAGKHAVPAGTVRLTALANFDRWSALEPDDYLREKANARASMHESAVRFMPDFRPHVIATDTFTPTTIRHFTGHDNGAVYGAPCKRRDGTTHLSNLFVCGTDQGWVGIIGTMMSGVVMANKHCLQAPDTRQPDTTSSFVLRH